MENWRAALMDSRERQLADWFDGDLDDADAAGLLEELGGDEGFREAAAKELVVRRPSGPRARVSPRLRKRQVSPPVLRAWAVEALPVDISAR